MLPSKRQKKESLVDCLLPLALLLFYILRNTVVVVGIINKYLMHQFSSWVAGG